MFEKAMWPNLSTVLLFSEEQLDCENYMWKKTPVCAQVTSCPSELVCDDKEEINKQKKPINQLWIILECNPPFNKQ